MKKQYVAPDFEIIEFEIADIITHSIATGDGNNDIFNPFGKNSNGVGFKVDGKNIYTDFGTFGGD